MRVNVVMICPFCNAHHKVEVDLFHYKAWENGELIQDAMPDLSVMEREQLITHLCPKCISEMEDED